MLSTHWTCCCSAVAALYVPHPKGREKQTNVFPLTHLVTCILVCHTLLNNIYCLLLCAPVPSNVGH